MNPANNNCIAHPAQRASLLRVACALAAVLGVIPARAGETVLHSFKPFLQGAFPQASLCSGPAGMLYGTASGGGPANAGVVFRLNAAGREAEVCTASRAGPMGQSPSQM
jgi:uncharacterized repeat protein (TIGR03803 family)